MYINHARNNKRDYGSQAEKKVFSGNDRLAAKLIQQGLLEQAARREKTWQQESHRPRPAAAMLHKKKQKTKRNAYQHHFGAVGS